jgi:hypothetical protein
MEHCDPSWRRTVTLVLSFTLLPCLQRPDGVLIQQFQLVLLLDKQRDVPPAEHANAEAAQRRVEWEVREKRAVLLRDKLHVRGLELTDDRSSNICTAYGKQQRHVLEQQLMREMAELSSANAAWQRVISEQNARKAAAQRLRRVAAKKQRDVSAALEKLEEHHTQILSVAATVRLATSVVLGGYDVQAYASELRMWLTSAALTRQPAEPPDWPWAADPAWLGLAPTDKHQQRFFRCQEEMGILQREANDMTQCYSAALAVCDQQTQQTTLQSQQLAQAMQGLVGLAQRSQARKDLCQLWGRLSWQHQRAGWLRRRLADASTALTKLTGLTGSSSNPHAVGGAAGPSAVQLGPLAANYAPTADQTHPPDGAASTVAVRLDAATVLDLERDTAEGQDAMFGDQTSDDEDHPATSEDEV